MTAMLPMLTSFFDRQATAPATSVPSDSRVRERSPVALMGDELHTCLVAFKHAKAIDLLDKETVLSENDLTPDIIPKLPLARLQELIALSEGTALKFQVYCEEWYKRWKAAVI